MAIQKIQNEGKMVEFTEQEYDVTYYELATYTHMMKKPLDKIKEIQEKVKKMRQKKQFVKADDIAEKFIRSGTKSVKVLPREEILEGLAHAWKTFKNHIFGYNQISQAEKELEEKGVNQKLNTGAE